MKYSELTNLQKKYKKYTISEAVLSQHLTNDEKGLYDNGKFTIKGNADYSMWHRIHALWDKIDKLVQSDLIDIEAQEFVTPEKLVGKHFDDNIDPILNHANGKVYDSKSKYYADLKASGHVIVESGMDKPRETRGDFDARKDVAKALNQLGY